jgi:hypothetical protein
LVMFRFPKRNTRATTCFKGSEFRTSILLASCGWIFHKIVCGKLN